MKKVKDSLWGVLFLLLKKSERKHMNYPLFYKL